MAAPRVLDGWDGNGHREDANVAPPLEMDHDPPAFEDNAEVVRLWGVVRDVTHASAAYAPDKEDALPVAVAVGDGPGADAPPPPVDQEPEPDDDESMCASIRRFREGVIENIAQLRRLRRMMSAVPEATLARMQQEGGDELNPDTRRQWRLFMTAFAGKAECMQEIAYLFRQLGGECVQYANEQRRLHPLPETAYFLTTHTPGGSATVCPYVFYHLVRDVHDAVVPAQARSVLERPYSHHETMRLVEDDAPEPRAPLEVAPMAFAMPALVAKDAPYPDDEDKAPEGTDGIGALDECRKLAVNVLVHGGRAADGDVDAGRKRRRSEQEKRRRDRIEGWEASKTFASDGALPNYDVPSIPSAQTNKAWSNAVRVITEVLQHLLSFRRGFVWEIYQYCVDTNDKDAAFMEIALATCDDVLCRANFVSLCKEHNTFKQHATHTSTQRKGVIASDVERCVCLKEQILCADTDDLARVRQRGRRLCGLVT